MSDLTQWQTPEPNEIPARNGEPDDIAKFEEPRVPHDMRWVFWGSNGLRAGWSILIFAAIFLLLLIGLSFVIGGFFKNRPSGAMPPGIGIISEAVQFAAVLAATWAMSRLERKPVVFYGYQGRKRGARFLWGLCWGFAAISTLVLSLSRLGYLSLDGRALWGGRAAAYAVLWGVMFLLVGFCEESIFRGYVQYTLTRGIGFWWGALLFAALFGLLHRSNPGESPVGLFSAAAIGLVFCLSLWYTGSLWWAVGFHAAWDWGQSFVYGTADSGLVVRGHLLQEHPAGSILWSGGTTGPEGSLLIVPLLAVMTILMVLWWGRRLHSPFAGAGWKPARLESLRLDSGNRDRD